ncbi:MAG: hypothetical protein ACRCZO_02100, partial [Cetobacterium sp.]
MLDLMNNNTTSKEVGTTTTLRRINKVAKVNLALYAKTFWAGTKNRLVRTTIGRYTQNTNC